MRDIKLATGQFYHIYNRGVDKRSIFADEADVNRLFQSLVIFNTEKRIESMQLHLKLLKSQSKDTTGRHLVSTSDERLVNIVAYCLNPNHYHLLLEQVTDNGIERFMHKIGNGYTKYFNTKYKRTGSLFQGTYKSVLIESDEQLLHTSVYINLNNRIAADKIFSLSKSSWNEYLSKVDEDKILCKKDIILDQFNSKEEYDIFAESSYEDIVRNKNQKL